jgi:NACalpha-BTF3-like transcription factor
MDDINIEENDIYTDHQTDHQTDRELTENVMHKAEIMRFNNGWNDNNERIVISVGENSASYKWMHEKCASNQKILYKFMSISLIVLSTALTAETIFPDHSSDISIDITRRIFLYIVNVLTVLQTFLKCEEMSEKHLAAASNFSNLYHDIQQQMCMFRRDRIDATKYVGDCLKQYDSFVINSPDISPRVLRSFKQTFKNADIAVPEIADRIQKIEIITEDQNNIKILQDQKQKGIEKKVKRKGIPLVMNKTDMTKNGHVCNLSQIHNAFQIHGDITDKDLENINSVELKELRSRFLQQKSDYEYQRFLQHTREDD